MTLDLPTRISLERLKAQIKDGTVNEGIPRTKLTKDERGTYTAHLEGFQSKKGKSPEDALSALHDYLLTYYNKLQTDPIGEHGRQQLRVLESFLALSVCDCGCSPDSYCYCRGFENA